MQLEKDQRGLGITIAGIMSETGTTLVSRGILLWFMFLVVLHHIDSVEGIFVQAITPNSAADRNGQIKVNDKIVKVNVCSWSCRLCLEIWDIVHGYIMSSPTSSLMVHVALINLGRDLDCCVCSWWTQSLVVIVVYRCRLF